MQSNQNSVKADGHVTWLVFDMQGQKTGYIHTQPNMLVIATFRFGSEVAILKFGHRISPKPNTSAEQSENVLEDTTNAAQLIWSKEDV
jgi:hypothetical protein